MVVEFQGDCTVDGLEFTSCNQVALRCREGSSPTLPPPLRFLPVRAKLHIDLLIDWKDPGRLSSRARISDIQKLHCIALHHLAVPIAVFEFWFRVRHASFSLMHRAVISHASVVFSIWRTTKRRQMMMWVFVIFVHAYISQLWSFNIGCIQRFWSSIGHQLHPITRCQHYPQLWVASLWFFSSWKVAVSVSRVEALGRRFGRLAVGWERFGATGIPIPFEWGAKQLPGVV